MPLLSYAEEGSVDSQDQQSNKKHEKKSKLINLGASTSAFNLGASENMIAWEKWHRVVGKAIHKRVEKASRTSLGEVVLLVTITKDLKISAMIVESSNQKLAEACCAATQELSGDTVLLFPQDSKREFVKFRYEYKRGFFLIPRNHYITDDYERVVDDQAKSSDAPDAPASITPAPSSSTPATSSITPATAPKLPPEAAPRPEKAN